MPSGDGGIFISYRRGETAWPARQLYEVLVARFGAGTVFKDVDDIEPGEDFVERITDAVAACDVLLALIGPHWLTMTDAAGSRRLDDPEDFVRLELSAALTRGVRVVPILVDGAKMPRADELPADLAPITRRQAVEISPVGFNTERLMASLTTLLARPVAPPIAGTPAGPSVSVAETPEVAEPAEPTRTAPADRAPSQAPDGSPAPLAAPAPVSRQPDVPSFAPPMRQTWGSARPPGSTATGFGTGSPDPRPPVRNSPPTGSGATPKGPDRRTPLLVGAGATAAALVVGALVWHPWTGGQSSGNPSGSVLPSTSVSAPLRPSTSPSPSVEPADLPHPAIMAHRGGLERHQLETLEAMEDAARRGFAVETDVRYTKDGVAVLVHDEAATKGLDCGGKDVRVSQTSLADLRKLCRSKPTASDPNSYRIPTLDATLEAIAAASPTAWVFLEVKTEESDAKLKALLATPGKYGLSERTVFTSFGRDRLARVAKADKTFRRMLFVSGTRVPSSTIARDGLWGVAVENGVADADYVASLQKIGLKVVLWNPNEAKAWARLAPMGADLLMTDYPEKYQEWLAKR